MPERIYLKPPAAVGDAVIATAHIPRLRERGFSVVGLVTKPHIGSLWQGIDDTETPTPDQLEGVETVVDIRGYLGNRFEYPGIHLVKLQATEIHKQGGPQIDPSPADVRINLSKDELLAGAQLIEEMSKGGGNLPVVIFEPVASTKNRCIPRETLRAVVNMLQRKVVCCIQQPSEKGNLIEGAVYVWKQSLRESAALLAAADAVVSVDSGPLHLVNGVLQGSKDALDELGLKRNQGKVVIAVGSTPGESVAYGNNLIVAGGGCDIVCGASGYPGLEAERLSQHFNEKRFFPSGEENDKSLCQFADYSTRETARCMASINAEAIIEAVLKAVEI